MVNKNTCMVRPRHMVKHNDYQNNTFDSSLCIALFHRSYSLRYNFLYNKSTTNSHHLLKNNPLSVQKMLFQWLVLLHAVV